MSGSRLAVKRTWVSSDDMDKLRESFDSRDRFMDKPNIVAGRVGRRVVPEWMRDPNGGIDSDKVRKFLKRKFPLANKFNPKCDCFRCVHPTRTHVSRANCNCRECRQTTLMLKWWTVIWETYEERKTASHIELLHQWNYGTVGYIVQQIQRAAAGVRLDGKARTGRPRGRPRRAVPVENPSSNQTSNGEERLKIAPIAVAA
jgi:hypothetical protein